VNKAQRLGSRSISLPITLKTDLVVDASLLVAGPSKVAAAACNQRYRERLPKHRQRALLEEPVDERHHPAVVAQRLPQRPAEQLM
jgi:hypothetical protein